MPCGHDELAFKDIRSLRKDSADMATAVLLTPPIDKSADVGLMEFAGRNQLLTEVPSW